MKRFEPQTSKGPDARFKGEVHPTIVFTGEGKSRARMATVHFAPGAHTAWHSHAVGQYIHVTEGVAIVAERGGEVAVLRPGDTVYTGPGVEHWHGAAPGAFMVHVVVWEAPDSGEEMTWLEHVTDVEYAQATESLTD